MKPPSSAAGRSSAIALHERPDPFAGFDDQRVGLGDFQDRPHRSAGALHAGQERLAMHDADGAIAIDDGDGAAIEVMDENRERGLAEAIGGQARTPVDRVADNVHGRRGMPNLAHTMATPACEEVKLPREYPNWGGRMREIYTANGRWGCP